MKKNFVILVIALIFISCERDIEFAGRIINPLVAVNCFITPDSTVSAYISMSRFFLKDSVEYRNVINAEVNLWVNGALKEKLTADSTGIYTGTYKPTLSDLIKLTINVPQMQQVSATTSFTEAPVIQSIDTQKVLIKKQYLWPGPGRNDTIGFQYKYKVNYKLKFTDNGSQKNYYRLIVRQVSYKGTWNDNISKIDTVANEFVFYDFDFTDVVSGNTKDPLADETTSPVGMLLSDTNNKYYVFSDDIFNGKTYTLQFSTNETTQRYISIEALRYEPVNTIKNKAYISLQSISKDYYLYLKTRSASSVTNYFSEPVQVYNNINGGVGILGSYTTSNIVKIDLP